MELAIEHIIRLTKDLSMDDLNKMSTLHPDTMWYWRAIGVAPRIFYLQVILVLRDNRLEGRDYNKIIMGELAGLHRTWADMSVLDPVVRMLAAEQARLVEAVKQIEVQAVENVKFEDRDQELKEEERVQGCVRVSPYEDQEIMMTEADKAAAEAPVALEGDTQSTLIRNYGSMVTVSRQDFITSRQVLCRSPDTKVKYHTGFCGDMLTVDNDNFLYRDHGYVDASIAASEDGLIFFKSARGIHTPWQEMYTPLLGKSVSFPALWWAVQNYARHMYTPGNSVFDEDRRKPIKKLQSLEHFVNERVDHFLGHLASSVRPHGASWGLSTFDANDPYHVAVDFVQLCRYIQAYSPHNFYVGDHGNQDSFIKDRDKYFSAMIKHRVLNRLSPARGGPPFSLFQIIRYRQGKVRRKDYYSSIEGLHNALQDPTCN